MKRKWVRILLVSIGTVSTFLGILGVLLPILPTTPFLLLAAACYARSSQRFYHWLMHNRYFGKFVRNYSQRRAVSLRVKFLTIALLWTSIGCSIAFAVEILFVRILLILIASGVTAHILTLRTLQRYE